MNEGAATLAADGTVLYCNRHLAHLLDVPLEQIIGCPVEAIVADPTARVLDAMLAKARLGESITSALELMSTTGRCIPVQVSLSRMKSVEPAAMCMVVTDLTDLRARDELIAAGKLSKSILDSAAEAIAVCDEAGTVITGNDALERLCGINPLFRPFDSVLPLEVGDANSERAQRFSISNALSGHLLTGLEVVLRRVDAPPFRCC
jgi:PAS domain S-box-containing protein